MPPPNAMRGVLAVLVACMPFQSVSAFSVTPLSGRAPSLPTARRRGAGVGTGRGLLGLRGAAEGARAELRPGAPGVDGTSGVDWFAADGVLFGDDRFDGAWKAWWEKNARIRCPFFRRRGVDLLEASLAVGRSSIYPAPGPLPDVGRWALGVRCLPDARSPAARPPAPHRHV